LNVRFSWAFLFSSSWSCGVLRKWPFFHATSFALADFISGFPFGITQVDYLLVDDFLISPVFTAYSQRNRTPAMLLQVPYMPAVQVQYADSISPPGFSHLSFLTHTKTL
jgi:hypothetical protein